jgi:hypothetical protein
MSQSASSYIVRYRPTGTRQWINYGSTTSLSEPIVGLQPNTSYDVQVTAVNPNGQTNSTVQTITTAGIAPAPPGGLTATNITADSLVLNWNPSATGSAPISYQVLYRVRGAGNFTNYGSPAQSTTAAITGLSPATSYDFQVEAENSAGVGVSATFTISTAQAGTIPSVPAGLAVTNVTNNSATFSWQPSTGTAPITYQPEYEVTGASQWTALPATSGNSVAVTGLAPNTQYTFGVYATNAVGASATATVTAITAAAPQAPAAPTGLAASNITSSGLTLAWSASASGTAPINYQVLYRVSGTGNFGNFGGQTTALSEAITGLAAATAYDFQVTASNSAGAATSTTYTVTTAAATSAPSAPTGLGASNITPTSLTLNWITSTGTAPITYQVQYRQSGGTSWINLSPTVTVGTESVTNLTPSTTYQFQVVASNAYGSATSTILTASTTSSTVAPSAPTGLAVGTVTQTSVALSWNASTGTAPITYTPQYSSGGVYANATSTTAQSTTVTGLSPGTPYTFKITASNSAGSATSGTIGASTLYAPSPDNTTLTSTTGTLVDTSSNVWRLNGSPMVVQENPAPAYAGYANAGSSANVTLLLLHSGSVYYQNSSNAWFQWSGTAWTSIAGDPRVSESAQGATLTSTSGTIYDAALNAWTLAGAAGAYTVNENGKAAGNTANVVLLLYWNHTVYQENSAGSWWSWSGSAWVSAPRDPRIVESAQGTTLNSTSGVIYDANLTAWTLVQSQNSGLQVAMGGTVDGNTANVVLLLYWNHTVYQENASGGWWHYDSTQSFPWVQDTGDPRGAGGGGGGGGTTPLFYDDFTSLSLINTRDSSTSGNNWQPAYWYATDGKLTNSTWYVNPFNPATPDNTIYTVSGGILSLGLIQTPAAQASAVSNALYIGANMTTEPHFKTATGYFECSAKVPLVPGTGFSFWVMQDVQWPPEIDVAEIVSGQNSDGSLWQVAKFSLWNSDPNNAQIVGEIYSYNNPNGVSINPADGYHKYGVLIDASNITVYWDRTQVGQFPLPAGYSQYTYFPIVGFGDGGSWSGPLPNPSSELPASASVDYIGVWSSFPGAGGTNPATISSISLSSTTVSASAAVGTTVGNITVAMSDGSQFSGSLSLGGAQAGLFQISAAVLKTAATLTAGSDAISITASNASGSLTQNFTITVTAAGGGGGGGTGPAASSSFVTADFTAAQNYISPGSGQQVVSQHMWGVSTGGTANTNFVPSQGGVNVASAQAAYAQVNPGLWRVNGNIPERGDTQWFNSDGSVYQSTWNNIINNHPKLDPLGVSGWIIGCNVGGASGQGLNVQPWSNNDTAGYGRAMGNLAAYLNAATMPNGKKFPILGFECHNEPDGHLDWNTLAGFYNAMTSAVKGVNANLLVCGPTTSSAGAAGNFKSLVNELDVFDYHVYIGGSDPGTAAYATTRGTNDASTAASNVGGKTQTIFLGEYNIDWYCSAASMQNYIGAIFDATMLMEVLNGSPCPFFAAIWDSYGDSNCGIIQGSGSLCPGAYFIAQGVRHVYGPRWKVTTNAAGFLTCAVSPSPTNWSLMLVNRGQGAQNGKTVAISHMPNSSSGTVTANVWQLTQNNQNGSTSTVQMTNGVSASMNFPDPSITIIYV